MKETNKKHILLRYSLVVGIVLAFSAAIVWDMVKTSVIYAGDWNAKADSILTQETVIEPERGKLLADNGTVLAANLQYFTARVDWLSAGIKKDTLMKYLPALADSLAVLEPSRTAQQWQEELAGAYERITTDKKKKNHSYRLIRRLLTHGEWERLKTFPYFNKGQNKSNSKYIC